METVENEKLAKLKTRKGGLGKNEHPADWQPMKEIQAKMGQYINPKELISFVICDEEDN